MLSEINQVSPYSHPFCDPLIECEELFSYCQMITKKVSTLLNQETSKEIQPLISGYVQDYSITVVNLVKQALTNSSVSNQTLIDWQIRLFLNICYTNSSEPIKKLGYDGISDMLVCSAFLEFLHYLKQPKHHILDLQLEEFASPIINLEFINHFEKLMADSLQFSTLIVAIQKLYSKTFTPFEAIFESAIEDKIKSSEEGQRLMIPLGWRTDRSLGHHLFAILEKKPSSSENFDLYIINTQPLKIHEFKTKKNGKMKQKLACKLANIDKDTLIKYLKKILPMQVPKIFDASIDNFKMKLQNSDELCIEDKDIPGFFANLKIYEIGSSLQTYLFCPSTISPNNACVIDSIKAIIKTVVWNHFNLRRKDKILKKRYMMKCEALFHLFKIYIYNQFHGTASNYLDSKLEEAPGLMEDIKSLLKRERAELPHYTEIDRKIAF